MSVSTHFFSYFADGVLGGGVSLPPIAIFGWGDSLGVGIDARDVGLDVSPITGIQQVRNRAPVGLSTTLYPLDQGIAPTGTEYLSPYNKMAEALLTYGYPSVYIVPHNINSSQFNAPGWGAGNTAHEAFVTRANAAAATIYAAAPTYKAVLIQFEGSNDANTGTDPSGYKSTLTAAISNLRTRIFKNGVSGTDFTNEDYIINGMIPEYLGSVNRTLYEQALRDVAASINKGKFYKMPEGIHRGDNLHPSAAGNRIVGPANQALVTDAVSPVISSPSSGAYSIFAGQQMLIPLQLSGSEYGSWSITGTDAASFEIVMVTAGTSGINLSRMNYFLRVVADGVLSAGTYSININAKDGAGNVTVLPYTVTCLAAYGTQTGTVTSANKTVLPVAATTNDARSRTVVPVTLGAGMNVITIVKAAGAAPDVSKVEFNGMVATRDANSGSNTYLYYLPSAQEQSGNLIITPTSSAITSVAVTIACVTNTKATPASSAVLGYTYHNTPHQTTSVTFNTGGVIVGGGVANGLTTEVPGATFLTTSGVAFTESRVSTGAIGANGTNGYSGIAAASFEPA